MDPLFSIGSFKIVVDFVFVNMEVAKMAEDVLGFDFWVKREIRYIFLNSHKLLRVIIPYLLVINSQLKHLKTVPKHVILQQMVHLVIQISLPQCLENKLHSKVEWKPRDVFRL